MARLRTIKPEFWTDERVGECPPTARLLFIACWNFADDYGGLDRSPKQLKAQAFPYDSLEVEPLIAELLRAGLLIEYEHAGKKYLHINGFRKHQRIEKPSLPRIPPYEGKGNGRGGLPEGSPRARGSSLGSGVESSGVESRGSVTAAAPPTRETEPAWQVEFRRIYPKRSGDPNWRGAWRAASARIAEGHTVAEFLAGAGRYAEFCRATGKERSEFVQQASRFLGPGKPFLEPWTLPPTKAEAAQDANLDASRRWLEESASAAG